MLRLAPLTNERCVICQPPRAALQCHVRALTRKCVNERRESWHVSFAGVRVGTIVERSGVANAAEPWE